MCLFQEFWRPVQGLQWEILLQFQLPWSVLEGERLEWKFALSGFDGHTTSNGMSLVPRCEVVSWIYATLSNVELGSSWCGITRGSILNQEGDPDGLASRANMYVGTGVSKVSRTQLFREKEGVAIVMQNRVYELPSLNGKSEF